MAQESAKSSEIPGYHKMAVDERLRRLMEFAGLSKEEADVLRKTGSVDLDTAGRMIENVVGTTEMPFGIATNFVINGRDYLIPMCLEEPSVVAAASNAAKMARPAGGFRASSDEPIMIGQVQLVGVDEPEKAAMKIASNRKEIEKLCNGKDAMLIKFGGGFRGLDAKAVQTMRGKMVLIYIYIDVRDAMGANAVNTMAEAVAEYAQNLVGGKVRLRIISNLATKRLARAEAVWRKDVIGEDAVEGILDAYAFADADPYRCATHNKGIMNGIDAVVIATSNDFRAVEAGAHAYAARGGSYKPLTRYWKDEKGDLHGSIELPIAVGTIGGATRTHPIARIALKILGVKSAKELAEVIASVGLAQNFAALRALSTEGIQRGHMGLHARNIAIIGGATGGLIDKVAHRMVAEKNINADRARRIVEEMKG